MMTSIVRFFLACVLAAGAALPSSAQTLAITGGKVFPVSGPALEHGTVLVVDGKITAVGADVPIPPGAQRLDATGKWVTPGFVHAATSLGLVEVDAVDPTDDTSAKGRDGIAAAVRVWDALNPASELWAPARQDGITQAVVLPQGGFIGGQAALVETYEGAVGDMVRKAPIGITLDLDGRDAAEVGSRGELFLRVRELLENARLYGAGRVPFETPQLRALWPARVHLRALVPVANGELPLLVHAERAADIEAVLALAREQNIKVVLYGGAEAWRVAPDLASARVPVVTGGLTNLPVSFDELGATLENAARLQKAGVPLVITSDGANTFRARSLRQHAGNAVANGLPWDAALRAVTLTPAEVFGVSATIGTLAAGREADIVVWSGDPFELATRAEHVFVRGRESQAPSREQLLTDRYRTPGRRAP